MTPTRPYRALRSALGSLVLTAVVGRWLWAGIRGDPLGPLWQLVVLVVVVASGYAVFGRRTFDDAAETARELQGDDTEGDDA